jgi:hypothetical protein
LVRSIQSDALSTFCFPPSPPCVLSAWGGGVLSNSVQQRPEGSFSCYDRSGCWDRPRFGCCSGWSAPKSLTHSLAMIVQLNWLWKFMHGMNDL